MPNPVARRVMLGCVGPTADRYLQPVGKLTALWSAVVPRSDALLGSAPYVSREDTSSDFPDKAAMCSGHRDLWSLAWESAPARSSTFATST